MVSTKDSFKWLFKNSNWHTLIYVGQMSWSQVKYGKKNYNIDSTLAQRCVPD